MRRETISFVSGGFRLMATLDLPESVGSVGARTGAQAPRVPGVLFCHGFTGHRIESRRLFARTGARLADAGIACLRFDHRGCGESEGDFADFTAAGLLEDVEAAISECRRLAWLDPARMAVLGYSLGGVSASYVMSRCPEMRAAVLWAPVSRPELLRRRLEEPDAMAQYQRDGYLDLWGFRVSRGLLDHLEMLKPLEWARTLRNPTLFCHAEGDDVVLPEHSSAFIETRGVPGDERFLLPAGDHGFGPAASGDQLVEKTANWLAARLG